MSSSTQKDSEEHGISKFVSYGKHYTLSSWRRYKKLNIYGKLIIWGFALFYVALGTSVIVVGPDRIAQFLYDMAQKIKHLRFGWLVLGGILVIISFPPCTGHTTTVSLCGFAYGMNGFPIAAVGSLLGSTIAFVVLRLLFNERLKKWSSSNEKWQALEAVIEAKGLPLIMLIRASPFPPWVYSTSLFASIQAVSLWQFVIATFVVFPKLALEVFIASRLASLSDGETRRHMDPQIKLINIAIIACGALVAILTSWIVYRSMQSHIRHLKGISPEVDELAAEAVEDAGEGAPLLSNYSTDEVDDEERTLRPIRSRSASPEP